MNSSFNSIVPDCLSSSRSKTVIDAGISSTFLSVLVPVTVILRVSGSSSPKIGKVGKKIVINKVLIFKNFTN